MLRLRNLSLMILTTLLASCGGPATPTPTPTPGGTTLGEKVILTIDGFGSGTYSATEGSFECKGDICTGAFPKDKTVTITATPASGWQFHHWTGCTSTTGTTCTVTNLQSATTIQPYFTQSTTPEISSDVVVLNAETMKLLKSDTNNVLIFDSAASQVRTLKTGNIIVSGQQNGFARRIQSVITLENGNTIIDTAPVDLEDFISSGTVVARLNDLPALNQSTWQPAPGVQLQNLRPQAAGEDSASFKLSAQVGSGKVEGQIQVSFSPEVGWQFGPGFANLLSARMVLNSQATTSLTLSMNASGLKTEPKQFAHWTGPTRVLMIGYVPVTLTPEADLFWSVKADGSIGVEIKPSYSLDMSAGVAYVKGAGVRGIGNAVGNGDFSINPLDGTTVEIEAIAELPIEGKIKVYGALAPKLILTPYITAGGSFSTQPNGVCFSLSADMAAKLGTGGEIELGNKTFGAEFTILDGVLFNLKKWENKNCDDKAPAKPGALTFTEKNQTLLIGWGAAKDEPSGALVNKYHIYRENSALGQASNTSYVDATIQPDTYYCYQVVAEDAAGNKSGPTTGCYKTAPKPTQPPLPPTGLVATPNSTTSINLTWIGSSDPNVTGYQILSNGNHVTRVNATTTTININQLQPDTRYCFVVRAYDKNGLISPNTTEACATTLPKNMTSWTMYLACIGQPYLFSKGLDLDTDSTGNLSIVGSTNDYDGSPLAYHLHGSFDKTTKNLYGVIDWTFADSNGVRKDSFQANLSTGDSGDVTMNQEIYAGCTASVRFVKGMNPLGENAKIIPQSRSRSINERR